MATGDSMDASRWLPRLGREDVLAYRAYCTLSRGARDDRHTVTIEFPDSTFSALRRAPEQLAAEVRVAAAIHWYQQARISMERAAECRGMNRTEFLAELARRRIDVFVVDDADLREELRRV